jgi:hypothetical protein
MEARGLLSLVIHSEFISHENVRSDAEVKVIGY